MSFSNVLRYAQSLVEESIGASWVAANGLLGAALAGAAMIWRGVLPLVSTDLTSVSNWFLSFAIYAICSWIVLFIASAILIAPYRSWQREHDARMAAEAQVTNLSGPTLMPVQESLLALIAKYQGHFAANKLAIGRGGNLVFDGQRDKSKDINLIVDLYGTNTPMEQRQFVDLMDGFPLEYLRRIPEMRWDSPFVVSLTEVAYPAVPGSPRCGMQAQLGRRSRRPRRGARWPRADRFQSFKGRFPTRRVAPPFCRSGVGRRVLFVPAVASSARRR